MEGCVPRNKILLVEDDRGIRFGMKNFLVGRDYDVEEAETVEEAERSFQASKPDLAIVDYKLPDGTALELLPRLKAIDPAVQIVVLTGHGSIELAVEAIRVGAEQFLTKPIQLPALLVIIERLLENQRSHQKERARQSRGIQHSIDPFVGSSAAIQRLRDEAMRIVVTDRPILILGETGSGKGVLAAWLHQHGPRAREPFVDLNCAGLSREFFETELFGHEKGAFTGAVSAKEGLLEVAHQGVLFLDEIGDVDAQVQPKLLKVLEEKKFRRVGEVRDRRVDIQLIAATHQDLGEHVREKKFRSDLYFRISTIPLTIPPLRERLEDVPVIARYLLEGFVADLGHSGLQLSESAERALMGYRWPGNIRELRNVLERAILLSDRRMIGVKDLRFDAPSSGGGMEDLSNLTLEEMERRHIELVLRQEQGRVVAAAQRLGIPRSSLYQKIQKYGIVTPRG
jgi:DNA-binding NtrC family response regulator